MISTIPSMFAKITEKSYQLIFISSLLLLLPFTLQAQTIRQSPTDVSAEKSSPEDQRSPGSFEEEMRIKRAIKYAEDEHKENLDRAREVLELGAKLQSSFQYKKSLDREDAKRLERLEKLTKQLRSKAGGSDSDKNLKSPPSNLADAIDRVADVSETLSKLVQKTPRQVVSADVIDEANVLLQLIARVRQYLR